MKQWILLALVVCAGLVLVTVPGAVQAQHVTVADATVAANLPETELMYPGDMKADWADWVGLEMGDGPFKSLYKPIVMQMYIAPTRHYIRPDMSGFAEMFKNFKPDQCADCHLEVTRGWANQWADSAHGNPRATERLAKKTEAIEKKLGRSIQNVGCAECHGASHDVLQMPYLDNSCSHCHLQQCEEFVGEKKDGRPSHYSTWISEVVPPWYIENYRRGEGVAQIGCDLCHPEMQRCDGCHMRHLFATKTAKKPGTCGKCHMGYDHPDYESYTKSAMGVVYEDTHEEWNWDLNLAEIVPGRDWKAPTCAFCHMYQGGGKWAHNVTSKNIWRMGIYVPKQRDYEYKSDLKSAPYGLNLPPLNRVIDVDAPDTKRKREVWIEVCSNCHSPRFARLYLDSLDEYMLKAWQHTDASMAVVQSLYAAGAIVPAPVNRDPWYLGDVIAGILGPNNLGQAVYNAFNTTQGYFPIFGPVLSTGDHFLVGPGRPHEIELLLDEQWFGHLLQGYKGTAHAQQDYSWWYGWAPMIQKQAKIQTQAVDLLRLKAVEDKLGLKPIGQLPSDPVIYAHTPLYETGGPGKERPTAVPDAVGQTKFQ